MKLNRIPFQYLSILFIIVGGAGCDDQNPNTGLQDRSLQNIPNTYQDQSLAPLVTEEVEREVPNYNTEEYDYIEENQFLSALQNPLSTFSIDVDNASYANVRRVSRL